MTTVETLLAEFDQEMASTRKMLDRMPEDKLGWKPHEKSFTLAQMGNHIAALPWGSPSPLPGRAASHPRPRPRWNY